MLNLLRGIMLILIELNNYINLMIIGKMIIKVLFLKVYCFLYYIWLLDKFYILLILLYICFCGNNFSCLFWISVFFNLKLRYILEVLYVL